MGAALDAHVTDQICYKKMRFLRERSGARVLDVGCRKGMYARNLGGKDRLVGLDVDLDALRHARAFLEVVRGDASAMPFKDLSFDTVVAGDVLEHVGDDVTTFREFIRVARTNVLLSVPRLKVPSPFRLLGLTWTSREDPTHRRYYEREHLLKLAARVQPSASPLQVRIRPWYPASRKAVGFWLGLLERINWAPGFLVEVVKTR